MVNRRRKRRVPEVLWRLFKDRARTLANTIISLISPSPFFQSIVQTHVSFPLHPNDPPDYRTLLNHCFVVINDNAPAFFNFQPQNRWPQRQIVQRAIEMIILEQPMSPNVISSSYDKCNHSSPIVDLLSCSAWTLLLQRVGDDAMFYLLKHSSIFLPLPHLKHQQVAGPPISNLILHKRPQHIAELQQRPQHSCADNLACRKKRDKVDNANSLFKRQKVTSYCPDGSMSFLSMHPANKCGRMSFFEACPYASGFSPLKHEENLNQELRGSNQIMVKPKKRSRPFRWQRHRKHRLIDAKETSDKACHKLDCYDQSSPCGGIQWDFSNFTHKQEQQCSCFLLLQTPQVVTKGAQINRQPLFYNSENPSSVLPQKHILNSLKPNLTHSKSLIQSIFGLSDRNLSAVSKPYSSGSGFCLTGSICLLPLWITFDKLIEPNVDCFRCVKGRLEGSARLESTLKYHSLVKLLKVLIRQTKCCKHLRLLDKHCAVSSLNQNSMANSNSVDEGNDLEKKFSKKSHGVDTEHCKETLETTGSLIEALNSYCSKSQVVSFIWAVCRNIVPPDLLGTPSNWRILRRNISKFVSLRRFEKFSLKQCMHKLKTSEFPFLSDKHSSCCLDAWTLDKVPGQGVDMHKELNKWNDAANMKHIFLQKWIYWFFSSLVVPLVQANFYATESESGKQEIYYYRKSIWEKLKNRVMASLNDQNYKYLDDSDVESIISHRSFGFSKLRLLPKEKGVRLIANLKVSSRMPAEGSISRAHSFAMLKKTHISCKSIKFKHFKPVNYCLRDTHAVLKGIQLKQPEKLGSSVFDYNDIYRKLCPFIIGLKNRSTTMPDVFIVVSDVSKAFDSIDQKKLLSVMEDVILDNQYSLKQFYQVLCTKKSLWARKHLILADRNIGTGFTSIAASVPFGSLHTVLVNQGFCMSLKKEELLFNLNEHVKRNVLQLDKTFYLQGIGIPQGSILSSLLCSLYFGHLERNVIFPVLEKTHGPPIEYLDRGHNCRDDSATGDSSEDRVIPAACYMLLRLIDDFLFISTSKEQAANFFSMLCSGFQDYNCYMNEDKFSCNFDVEYPSGLRSNRVYVGEDGISFIRWSGLLLNSCTLEVQADYTRYLNNHLSSSLTVCWQGKPAHHLKRKLCNFMRPKCHPIFFDSNINSAPVVRLNIYQAFLLSAMKFHCYVSDMSYICQLRKRSYLKIIETSLRYMYVLIKKRMLSVHLGSYFHPVLKLEEEEVEWLGLNAYIQVLKRKQSRHKQLLSLLRLKLSSHRIGGNVSSQLQYAIDSSHSSLIWKIRY